MYQLDIFFTNPEGFSSLNGNFQLFSPGGYQSGTIFVSDQAFFGNHGGSLA
jgi:hypothetical protein